MDKISGTDLRRGRLAWGFLAVAVVACVGYLMLPGGVAEAVGYLVVAAFGVVMSVVGACLMRGPRRHVWALVAAGQVLYLVGDVLWVVFENVLHIAPYPSVADVAYLARYPLVALGLAWLIRGRRRGRDRAAFLDAAIITSGVAVLATVFVVGPAAAGGGETLLSQVVAAAYPVADLLLFAVLVRLFTSGAARTPSLWSLAGGLGILLTVDIQYVLSVVSGAWYPDWLNVGWLVAYLLVGFAVLHPSVDQLSEPAPERPERMTFVRLLLLGLALALAPLTNHLRDLTGGKGTSEVVLIGGIVGVGLVLARIWSLLAVLQAQAVQLSALARRDGLTGIANRRTWDHELSRACAAAREQGQPLAVALLDMDHFKLFNDTHGHLPGDLALKETAAMWSGLLDERGLLARYGGEEFTVLLPNTTAEAAERLLDQMRISVAREQTCSIGLAIWDGHEDPAALLERTDKALYHAKRTGRNRIAVHDGTGVRDTIHHGWEPATALHTVFQPIIDLETGRPFAYEALSRFPHGTPREVFDQAARLGTAPALEAAAIRSALAGWTGPEPLCINVSLPALTHHTIQQALPWDLSGLILEITETDLGFNDTQALPILAELRARGARIAVDDMGVGTSNIERVLALSPEIIKLDMSLIRRIDSRPTSQAAVRAAVSFARETGCLLVAEGVETEAEQQTLQAIGIGVAQGYLLGRPGPAPTTTPASSAAAMA
ncbi:MAG: EAL domain-containing protein [Actinomycetes bacterium]